MTDQNAAASTDGDPQRTAVEAANAQATAFAERWKTEYPVLASQLQDLLQEELRTWEACKQAKALADASGDSTLPAVLTPGFLVVGDRDWNRIMGNLVRLPNTAGDFWASGGEAPFWSPPHSFQPF